jgi:hypothetical protein
MSVSRNLFRAWLMGSALWLLGWSTQLLLAWPSLPALTDYAAAKRQGTTELQTDSAIRFDAFGRLTGRTLIDPMFYGFGANDEDLQPLLAKGEDAAFMLTHSDIEIIDNTKHDTIINRVRVLRHVLNHLRPNPYSANVLSRVVDDSHRETVRHHVATIAVAAFEAPAISLALGWAALLWTAGRLERD